MSTPTLVRAHTSRSIRPGGELAAVHPIFFAAEDVLLVEPAIRGGSIIHLRSGLRALVNEAPEVVVAAIAVDVEAAQDAPAELDLGPRP